MIRVLLPAACVVAMFGGPALATAEPGDAVFAIGKCYDPSQPPVQRPASFAYNCDNTGVMKDMAWTAWGADGANATGTDSSVECRPNCAQGRTLVNPIQGRRVPPKIKHEW